MGLFESMMGYFESVLNCYEPTDDGLLWSSVACNVGLLCFPGVPSASPEGFLGLEA